MLHTADSAAHVSQGRRREKNDGRFSGIHFAGLLVGVLDIVFAFVSAGGRCGICRCAGFRALPADCSDRARSRADGPTAALGLVLHTCIAQIMAAVFITACRHLPILPRHAVPAGLLYGVGVFLGMDFVGIPLSAIPKRQPAPDAPWPGASATCF